MMMLRPAFLAALVLLGLWPDVASAEVGPSFQGRLQQVLRAYPRFVAISGPKQERPDSKYGTMTGAKGLVPFEGAETYVFSPSDRLDRWSYHIEFARMERSDRAQKALIDLVSAVLDIEGYEAEWKWTYPVRIRIRKKGDPNAFEVVATGAARRDGRYQNVLQIPPGSGPESEPSVRERTLC